MRLSLLIVVVLAGCPNNNAGSSCPGPFKLCGSVCTAVNVDPANCGGCGMACPAGQQCQLGNCVLASCPSGSMPCDNECVDVSTDNANCGGCGLKCLDGQRCSLAECANTCAAGFADCTTYCADTMNDSQNCGACGTKCPSGQRCAAGACTASCAPGRTACAGACVDTMSDAANCGACNMACPAGEICQAGACVCGFASVSLGRLQSCGLRSDGKVVCAGSLNNSGQSGQLPDGSGGTGNQGLQFGATSPWVLAGDSKQVGTGDGFACILKNDGSVLCAGSNARDYLGTGDLAQPSPRPTPVPVMASPAPAPLTGVTQISVGAFHSCALESNGQVWCWGDNAFGELGKGDILRSAFAVQVALPGGVGTVKKLAAGAQHTCLIGGNDTVWCWGRNDARQCGASGGSPLLTPTELPGLTQVADLVSGWHHTCAIRADKSLWCWGNNDYNQAGISFTVADPVPTPTPVPNVGPIAAVAAGPSHTCLRKTDDTIWCWGWNRHGTVGNNTIDLGNGPDVSHYNPSLTEPPIGNPVPTPVPVVTADGTPLKATALAASHAHTCAIVGASQHLWCWGNNLKGQSGLTTPFSKVAAPMFSCGY